MPTEFSLDEHVCCGVGVCLTGVTPVPTNGGPRRALAHQPAAPVREHGGREGGWEY